MCFGGIPPYTVYFFLTLASHPCPQLYHGSHPLTLPNTSFSEQKLLESSHVTQLPIHLPFKTPEDLKVFQKKKKEKKTLMIQPQNKLVLL